MKDTAKHSKIERPSFRSAVVIALLTLGWLFGGMAELSKAAGPMLVTYGISPMSAEPVLDGKLDDACWKTVPEIPKFFGFRVEPPFEVPPEIKTMAKIGAAQDALFVGIYCYETNMAALRVNHTKRDDGSLWEDDCVELYFSPDNNPETLRKFTINSVGNVNDFLKNDITWNAAGWAVATAAHPDGWSVEVRIPWSDLGHKPREMEVWRFSVIRFAWTGSPKGESIYQGAVTAPGMYDHWRGRERMGYMVFSDRWAPMLDSVPLTLVQGAGPEWRLPTTAGVLTYADYGYELRNRQAAVRLLARECRNNLWRMIDKSLQEKVIKLESALDEASKQIPAQGSVSFDAWTTGLRQLDELEKQFNELRMQMVYDRLLDQRE